MKLATTIQPRADGTVIVRNGAAVYQFHTTRSGRVVGDVDDEDLAAELIAGGKFSSIGGQKSAPTKVPRLVNALETGGEGSDAGDDKDESDGSDSGAQGAA